MARDIKEAKKTKKGDGMKRKLTLSIDEDVYNGIQELPRKLSISDIVTWLLKGVIADIRAGGELSQEEFDEWVESTPEGQEFREKFKEEYGPYLNRLEKAFNSVGMFKEENRGKRRKKKKGSK